MVIKEEGAVTNPSPMAKTEQEGAIEFERDGQLFHLMVSFESACGDYGGIEADERDATAADLVATLQANPQLRASVLAGLGLSGLDFIRAAATVEELTEKLRAAESELARQLTELQGLYAAFQGSGHSPKNSREAAQAIGQMHDAEAELAAELRRKLDEALALLDEASERDAKWLDDAWDATGVASAVRGLTTLEDVIRVQRQECTELRRKLEEAERKANATFDELRSERDHYVHEAARLGRELQAAEAELVHTREAAELLRDSCADGDLAFRLRLEQWASRDQKRAATTEEQAAPAAVESRPAQLIRCDFEEACPGHADPMDRPCEWEGEQESPAKPELPGGKGPDYVTRADVLSIVAEVARALRKLAMCRELEAK